MSHDPQSPSDAADFDDHDPDDFDECDEFECAAYWTGARWFCPLAGTEDCDWECTETFEDEPGQMPKDEG